MAQGASMEVAYGSCRHSQRFSSGVKPQVGVNGHAKQLELRCASGDVVMGSLTEKLNSL